MMIVFHFVHDPDQLDRRPDSHTRAQANQQHHGRPVADDDLRQVALRRLHVRSPRHRSRPASHGTVPIRATTDGDVE